MIMCEIKDIKVQLLDTGHAIATFRKQWQTAGPRVLITEEQDELTLIRDQGKWQIASEKRIKLYGVRKEYATLRVTPRWHAAAGALHLDSPKSCNHKCRKALLLSGVDVRPSQQQCPCSL